MSGVVTNLSAPRGVLDGATQLLVTVFEGDVSCNATTGQTSYPGGAATASAIASAQLSAAGCAANVRFCGQLQIEKSDAERVFEAKATGEGGMLLGAGCTEARVNQDSVPVEIAMFRYVQPAVCGDGIIQVTEQCEPEGADATICDESCHSVETLISKGDTGNGTAGVGAKSGPAFLWPTGSDTTGRFIALYTYRANATVDDNISVSALSPQLTRLDTPPALRNGDIFLSNGSGAFPPRPAPRQQSSPQAAFLSETLWVAFQDDDTPQSNGVDIHLRSVNSAFDSPMASPFAVNGPTNEGEPGIQSKPAIAASSGSNSVYIAWLDSRDKISGRVFVPSGQAGGTTGSQVDVSTGTNNSDVSVADLPNGWAVAWQSRAAVFLRTLGVDGAVKGDPRKVSDAMSASHPRVATLPDGRLAVTWAASGGIFVQRFDSNGTRVEGDQASRINVVSIDSDQEQPVIAPIQSGNGSFLVAWIDSATRHVWARVLGGSSGFLVNSVSGQSTDFRVSIEEGRNRTNPALAVGGSGPFVAVGWEDQTTDAEDDGIYVRRIGLPFE